MGTSVFSVALTGLRVAQGGLQTTSHNISNVNTAGYSRQEIIQSTQSPEFTGQGYFGTGAEIQTVKRSYNQFLDSQLQAVGAKVGYYNTYNLQIQQLSGVLADKNAGLQPALNQFYSSLQNVAANPSDVAARQSLLSSSQVAAGRFTDLNNQFTTLRLAANSQISQGVDAINGYASQIAVLNDSIAKAKASNTQGSLPNDLLDQRDQLIQQLNQRIQITSVAQADGTTSLFIANGQPLVVSSNAFALSTTSSAVDSRDLSLFIQTGSGTRALTTANLGAGELSALYDFRDGLLTNSQNQLGQIATVFAGNVNTLHKLGEDLTGQAGGNFYNVGTPQVISNSANTGSGVIAVSVNNTSKLQASDYRLSYDGTNYSLTRLTDNTVVDTFAPGALPRSVASEGLQISLTSGTVQAGDSFSLQPVRDVASSFAANVTGVNAIAAGSRFRTVAAASNTGTGVAQPYTITNPQTYATQFSSFTGLTINFTGVSGGRPQYQVVDGASNTVLGTTTLSSSGTIDIPTYGISVQLTGTPATGDAFNIRAKIAGDAVVPGDNRNAIALGSLQTAKLTNNGTATVQQSYGQIVSSVGNKAREVKVTGQSQQTLQDNLTSLQQSFSGVNLDEEAANLLKYQQAYQASSKVIQIASQLFSTILQIGS